MKRTDFQPMMFRHPTEDAPYEQALFVVKKNTNELYGSTNRKVFKYALDYNWYIPLWDFNDLKQMYSEGDSALDSVKIPYVLEKKLWEHANGE
jgi:hypothetical protein